MSIRSRTCVLLRLDSTCGKIGHMFDKPIPIRDIVMDTIIGFLVGVQVYLLVDELTDGRLSRDLSVKMAYTKAKIKEFIDREQSIRKSRNTVIFEAIIAKDGSGDIGRDSTED